jgi:DNA-binding NarL/FixJ family response regulator/putative methionine-R-sulfoxide reductase with GAF domain
MAELFPRVLVVDDERFFREAIAGALADAGIACEAVEGSPEAQERARDPNVGVVVLDIGLDGVAGMELVRRLRAERPALRIIVVSAHPDHDLVLEALRLEASDYLAKPLHDEELVLAVRRALAGYDVESSWQRLRERLRRAEARCSELARLAETADPVAGLESFASAVSTGCAEVLEASKTSLMLYDEGRAELWVAAATGSVRASADMDPVALGQGVAGVALSLGEAVIVDDVYTDRRFAARPLRDGYDSASLAVVPMRSGEHLLGVLCATDRAGGAPFGEDDLALLKLIAVPVSGFLLRRLAALERARVPEPAPEPPAPAPAAAPPAEAAAPEEADADAELAREICDALVAEIEPDRVFDAALRPVSRRLGGAAVALFLIDNQSGDLVRERQVEGDLGGDRERLPRSRGLTGSVLQAAALVASDHPDRDPRFDRDTDTPADGEVRPLVCVPLRLRGKVLGLLRAWPDPGLGASPRTAEILSAAMSAAVRNVLLYRSLLESIDEVAEARRQTGTGHVG